ncbi:glycosyltransferase family 4 protein [Salinicoccus sp. CNSTN-B1]
MQKKIVQGVTSSMSVLLIEDQVHFIERNGYSVKIVCNNDFDRLYRDLTMDFIPFEREIHVAKDIRALYELTRYLRREQPDIVNFSTPKAGLLGMVAGFLSGVKSRIYMQRGLRLETVTGVKKIILYTTEWLTCFFSTHVIVISDSLEEELIARKLLKKGKVVRIGGGSSNGTDMETFDPLALDSEKYGRLRHEVGIEEGDFIIGYAGRMTRDKGVDELVQAFESLSSGCAGIKLLLVGDFEAGDPITKSSRERIVEDEDIIHLPFTDDIAYYYRMMDIFAFPTFREGFGNVSVEAQAMGVPVVSFNSTGARDTLAHGATGLLTEERTSASLAEAIQYLFRHPEERLRMSAACRAFVAQRFDRKAMQSELLDFYDSLGEQSTINAEKEARIPGS